MGSITFSNLIDKHITGGFFKNKFLSPPRQRNIKAIIKLNKTVSVISNTIVRIVNKFKPDLFRKMPTLPWVHLIFKFSCNQEETN